MSWSLSGLLRLSSNYHAPVRRSIQRVVDSEVKAVSGAITAELGVDKRSISTFKGFLENYYRRGMGEVLKRNCWPVMQAFVADVRKQAAGFLDLEDVENVDELQQFMGGYLNGFGRRYIRSSEGQLLSIVDEFKKDPDELISHLRKRLGQWEKRRAVKMASDEVVRAECAVALETWVTNGVKKLRWVTNPKGKHCPWCAAMDDRIIKSGFNFIDSGDTLYVKMKDGKPVAASISATGKKDVDWLFGKEEHKGKDSEGWSALKMFGDKKHPPIHKGCVCRIVPAG